ncbi:hypothetical protein [Bradyrhizobium daqingense]|uniref:hypothetical protein n=1 Tax=Bradyrhizobium daqingense TaxID=993502 RepID=UPI00384B02AE
MKRFTYHFFLTLRPVTISGGRAKLAGQADHFPPHTCTTWPGAIQDLAPDGDNAAAQESLPRQLILRRSVAEGVSPNYSR